MKEASFLDYYFDPELIREGKSVLEETKNKIRQSFRKIDPSKSYPGMFEMLWYTQLPCFDVKNVTSDTNQQHGVLKSCMWEGVEVPCSAIFKMTPTDRGMCCTFNLEAAESMFRDGKYRNMIEKLQNRDKVLSFDNISGKTMETEKPVPHVGRDKGLTLILDAHTNLLAQSSVNSDFQGFLATVNSNNQFPMTSQKSAFIRPGHYNWVAMKGTKITAEEGIRQAASPEKRACYFEDEKHLEFHKKYSQGNCLLECSMKHALIQETNVTDQCVPWFLPVTDNEARMCDPYEKFSFEYHMRSVPDEYCSHCLPDCDGTVFDISITAAPFRRCDTKNLGLSKLCSFNDMSTDAAGSFMNPPIWGDAVLQQYKDDSQTPSFIDGKVHSNKRFFSEKDGDTVFSKAHKFDETYDAYNKDIAWVTFFFETSTAFQFHRQPRMSLVDYLSSVGGILGLCMGISLVSILELAYWLIIGTAKNSSH